MKNLLSLSLLLVCGASSSLLAANTVGLNTDSGDFTVDNLNDVTPLSGGSAANGNGDVLQIGYYTGATAANPFLGIWTPLTGMGGADSAFTTTSIGDTTANGAGNGTFALDLVFTQGSTTSGVSLPAAGQIMSIRFYNSTTVASSTDYGAVSDASWKWIAPGSPAPTPMNFSLDDSGLLGNNGNVNLTNDTVFTNTAINVPEPSAALLLVGGLVILGLARRRLLV